MLFKELGPSQLLPYAVYKAQLRSGKLENSSAPTCPRPADPGNALAQGAIFRPSSPRQAQAQNEILQQAAEIVSGEFHPFSGGSEKIVLTPPGKLWHWTKYSDTVDGRDIKTIWEPARFGWVFPLCQAYTIQVNESYPRTFWRYFEQFIQENPENLGPNWVSGQEAALRFIPWLLAAQIFAASPETTPERQKKLLNTIWQHTYRISLTLNYSRSQNNNHYLSEALGLMIGGTVFADTPSGRRWFKLGSANFEDGILRQIDKEGTYSQHSTNYHRLMMHLALIYKSLAAKYAHPVPARVQEKLQAATRWMTAQMDPAAGHLPNLGHNDGSNILSFGSSDYLDYRPVVQAASRAFLGGPCLPQGSWDELSAWLGLTQDSEKNLELSHLTSPAIHSIESGSCRAFLRSVQFHSRPAHADLLSVDLWQDGVNLLADAGTYAYNLPEPWQNRLAGTAVHNTIVVNGQDQMVREGKFLWLERARSLPIPSEPGTIAAILYCNVSDAYTQIRTIGFPKTGEFQVLDRIEFARLEKTPLPVTIQYLLPDWEWKLEKNELLLFHESRQYKLIITGQDPHDQSAVPGTISLVRAGKALNGKDKNQIRGWYSPTYLEKTPALSFSLTFTTTKSLEILTRLIL